MSTPSDSNRPLIGIDDSHGGFVAGVRQLDITDNETPRTPHSSAGLAVALLAGLLILVGTVAASAADQFSDSDGNLHESSIEAIAAAGITRGCNPPRNTLYCPDGQVSRGAMAAFLVRALGLTDDGGRDWFLDDDASIFEHDINRLAAAGITKGCNPPSNDLYCPDAPVTRGAFAAFLVRAFGYEDSGGGDRFVDDDGSIFENDIDKLGSVGVTKGCNPPVNDKFCPTDVVVRDAMATMLARALGLMPSKPHPVTPVEPATPDPSISGPFDAVVRPGESVQVAINSLREGSTILIKAGVHKRQHIVPKTGMTFVGESGAVLDGGGVTDYAFQSHRKDHLTNVTIRNLEVRNYVPHPSHAAINGHGAAGWVVEDCRVHHNSTGAGIRVGSNGVIRNCEVHHNGVAGIKSSRGATNVLIEDNTVYSNTISPDADPFWEGGGLKSSSSAVVVRSNHFYDNNGPGIWFDIHAEDVIIEDNLIENNRLQGIFYEISYRATIRRNVIRNNGHGDHRTSPWGSGIQIHGPDVEVYANHLEGNRAGINVIAQSRDIQISGKPPVDPKNIRVYHNVVVDSGQNGVVVWGGDPIAFETTTFTGNKYRYRDRSGAHFKFDGGSGDFAWWQGKGHDLDGSIEAS